jgi:hypothetical protein
VKRAHLEHLIRAAGAIANDDDLVVIGSQAILGQFPDPPASLTASMEADLYPRHHPERADDIDGAIGEGSSFHALYGYYAQGVGPETATLPAGWEGRLVRLSTPGTRGVTGWCLEAHDLAVAKLVAGRRKDLDFVQELARHCMIERARLDELVNGLPVTDAVKELVRRRAACAFTPTKG